MYITPPSHYHTTITLSHNHTITLSHPHHTITPPSHYHTITPPSHYHTITLSHPPVTIFHGRYLHSSWNSSADAKKIGVGSISPRASRRGTVSFGIGHPLGCRAIDRKPPQGDATCTVEYGRALLPLMYLLHVSYNILVPGTWYPVISYVARLLSLAS